MSESVVALPGTLCPPEIFDLLAEEAAPEVRIEPISWLTSNGPWDLERVAEDVAGVIASRYETPVILAGHSTGGAIALLVALAHPQLISGLMLVDTGAHMRGHGDVKSIISAIRSDWSQQLRTRVLDRSFNAALPPETRARWIAWSDTVRQDAALSALQSQADLDLRPELEKLTMPVAVVYGIHDQARTINDAQTLRAGINGATLHLLETGHTPVYEAPHEVFAILTELRHRITRRDREGSPLEGPLDVSR